MLIIDHEQIFEGKHSIPQRQAVLGFSIYGSENVLLWMTT